MREFTSRIVSTKNDELQCKIIDYLNDLTKPQGSLGRLEEFALRYCLCRGSASAAIKKMKLFTFAGDHGVTEENITPFPSEVTPQMAVIMAKGKAAVSVMCCKAGIDYAVVDAGIKGEVPEMSGLIKRKVANGTRNFAKDAAMTSDECRKAIKVGFDLAIESGVDLLGIGEMGIGNSSSASALYSLLLDLPAEVTTGTGTGSIGAMLEKKKNVIESAMRMHSTEWDRTPFDALRRVGGLEIAAMAGMIFGGASHRIPVIVDGFIATAAALVAMRMEPAVRDYLFFAHASAESFHSGFLQMEGIRPILTLDMRLGEGTGSVLAMQIIAQAMECYGKMATFSSIKIA
jgi:nicotinate-nucleotide--dimethylbenzimidazole phosphoribosyltransferase